MAERETERGGGSTRDTASGRPMEARKRHLEILLGRLTAHADVMRHHLPAVTHNPTRGFAAEAGVREVLRQVLPRNLAVTSGFIRGTGGNLIVPTQSDDISPQTDVIIYDAMRVCPLYAVDGVEIIAAPDVLGVFEVKDSGKGEYDLFQPTTNQGALAHIAELAKVAPQAFRAVVLIEGGRADTAQKRIADAGLTRDSVPHVVYSRSVSAKSGYLAFHHYAENKVHIHDHGDDEISALASFLRVVTSFFAVQGLATTSIFSDLRPDAATKRSELELEPHNRKVIRSLRREILKHGEPFATPARYEEILPGFFATNEPAGIRSRPVIGLDANDLPTAGVMITVQWKDRTRSAQGAFFTTTRQGVFTCVDRPLSDPKWVVYRETIDGYLQRVGKLPAEVFMYDDFALDKDEDRYAGLAADL